MNKIIGNIKSLLMIAILWGATTSSFSQQTYRTVDGVMGITMKYNDSTLVLSSHKLLLLLNYETGEIIFQVPYETFITGVDSINEKLKLLDPQVLEYKGKLGIQFINTKDHPSQKFEVEGTVISAISSAFVKGNGTLIHTSNSGGSVSCILNLSFKYSLTDLNLSQLFPGADNSIQIDIQQAVLKRETD